MRCLLLIALIGVLCQLDRSGLTVYARDLNSFQENVRLKRDNLVHLTNQSEECLYTDNQYFPDDCSEVQRKGYESGVYEVRPLGAPKPYLVYCDLDFNGGGWTIVQQRFNGVVNFYRNFCDYETGFGEITGEHWVGLEAIHELTSRKRYELYIELGDFDNNTKSATYKTFSIASKEDGYRLKVATYTGDIGDAFTEHNGNKFSTFDVDNDIYDKNCAVIYKGAWWYNNCHYSNLNGEYITGVQEVYATGIVWLTWRGHQYPLKTSKMMIRPVLQTTRYQNMKDALEIVIRQNELINAELVLLRKQYQELLDQSNLKSGGTVKDYPEDCAYVIGNTSDVYKIKPFGSNKPFSVYCDLNFQEQKWTVIQNRYEGKVDFYQNYRDYQNGFGNLYGEHWLGLENIYRIVRNGDYELYVELTDHENVTKFAKFKDFSICGEDDGYRLIVAGYIGDAGDSLALHNGMKFTTFDKDQDLNPANCAIGSSGAWWYTSCYNSNLNGLYTGVGSAGMTWQSFHNKTLKTSKMIIRKKNPISYERQL